MKVMHLFSIVCGIALGAQAFAEKEPLPSLPMDKIPSPFDGTIFSMDEKKKLYTFSRKHTVKDGKSTVSRSYKDTDGKEVVTEHVVYDKGRLAEYDVKWFQTGEETWVRIENGKIKFKMKDRHGKVDTNEEDTMENGVIGEQIGDYLFANWDKLVKGETIRIRLLIPRRKETIGFKLFKISQEGEPGNMKVKVKMKAATWIISLLVNPLVFEFEEKDGKKKLLRYTGRVTPYIAKTKEKGWDDLEGVTVFKF